MSAVSTSNVENCPRTQQMRALDKEFLRLK